MAEIKTILTIKANGLYCDKNCWPGHVCQFGLKGHGAMRSRACLEAEREYERMRRGLVEIEKSLQLAPEDDNIATIILGIIEQMKGK